MSCGLKKCYEVTSEEKYNTPYHQRRIPTESKNRVCIYPLFEHNSLLSKASQSSFSFLYRLELWHHLKQTQTMATLHRHRVLGTPLALTTILPCPVRQILFKLTLRKSLP